MILDRNKILLSVFIGVSGIGMIIILVSLGYTRGYGKFERYVRRNKYVNLLYTHNRNVRLYGKNTRFLVARVIYPKKKYIHSPTGDVNLDKNIAGALYVELDLKNRRNIENAPVRFFYQWRPQGYRQIEGIFPLINSDGSVNTDNSDIHRISEEEFLKIIRGEFDIVEK